MNIALIENSAKKAKDYKYEDCNKINNETNEKTNPENTNDDNELNIFDKQMSIPNEEEEYNKSADELSNDGKTKPKTATVRTQEDQAKIDATTVKQKVIIQKTIDNQKEKMKDYKQALNINEPISQLPKIEDKSSSEVESSASFGKPSKPRIIQQPKSFNSFLNSDFDAEPASDEYD